MEIKNEATGFLLIDKPVDWTSHDVVGYLRRVTGIKKIGHAGTLDPFATGLLIVAIGRQSTKRIDEFKDMPKEYVATVQLGAVSDTQDCSGEITMQQWNNETIYYPTHADLQRVLQSFLGKQNQIPPMFSAKKVDGKKLYELARKGIEIERKPNEIEIFDIQLESVILDSIQDPSELETSYVTRFTIRVSCSPGTYIRTLCHDIGQTLGTGAYCEALRRTQIGTYSVDDARPPKDITAQYWKQELISL